eukprot:scaffold224623_cov35-Tisochrysis_lutea.AAC.3
MQMNGWQKGDTESLARAHTYLPCGAKQSKLAVRGVESDQCERGEGRKMRYQYGGMCGTGR